jgi:RNA polymerase sigma-70 factor (ECF subfamily)
MAADPGPESVVIRKIEYEELDAALSNLPDRYREVLILAEWDGLDRESIAQLEGVSRNAIDQRISRAYKKLARRMNHRTPRSNTYVVPHAIEERGDV